MITSEQIQSVMPQQLANDADYPARVREMTDIVMPWLETHNVTIRFSRTDPIRWWLIGPDARNFPHLTTMSNWRALWCAHHFVGATPA